MSRSRPASNPLSFHQATGQHYVTRAGKRIYLGADYEQALVKYHSLALGITVPQPAAPAATITAKELANRFIAAQQANWRNIEVTKTNYTNWLRRFLRDHPKLIAGNFTIEMFARWKISLKERDFSAESINNYLGAVRSMFAFAEDIELIGRAPKLRRIKNEPVGATVRKERPLYTAKDIRRLLALADVQLKPMILLGLNCGFGPKDVHDLTWDHFEEDRVWLSRSKTGVAQTYLLWPETLEAVEELRQHRAVLIERLADRDRHRTDGGHVFITRFWKPLRRLVGSGGRSCAISSRR